MTQIRYCAADNVSVFAFASSFLFLLLLPFSACVSFVRASLY